MDNDKIGSLNLKIDAASPTVELRVGEAATVFDPEKVDHIGIIYAPGDWAAMRHPDPETTHVVANYASRVIILRCDEKELMGTHISGFLALNPKLSRFRINANHMFSHKELFALLRFCGLMFQDKVAYNILLDKLQTFNAKVQVEIDSENDLKGAILEKKMVAIKTELDLQFTLKTPIFTGCADETFLVDICVGLEGTIVKFWLESVELSDLMEQRTEAIFAQELARLTEYATVKQY